jgi:hypothetical protein
MRKQFLTFLIALAVTVGAAATASAQVGGLMFPGPGPGHSAGAGYQGPGDVVASPKVYWGLRCITAAYAGNVADVYAPADASHTLLTCSAGGTINETLQSLATTCAVSCTVKTLYDQTLSNGCFGLTCDIANATEANRPTLILNCTAHNKPCMQFTLASSQVLNLINSQISPNLAISTGYEYSLYVQRTGSFTTQQNIVDSAGSCDFGFSSSANTVFEFGGSQPTASMTDSAFHTAQIACKGGATNAEMFIDTTSNPVNIGTGTDLAAVHISGATQFATMKITEVGIWPALFTGPNKTQMNTNQTGYW